MSLENLIPSNPGEESRGILEEPLEGLEKKQTNKKPTTTTTKNHQVWVGMGQWSKVRTLIQAPKKKERNKDNGGMYGSVSLEGCLGVLANLKLNLCLFFYLFIYLGVLWFGYAYTFIYTKQHNNNNMGTG